MKTMREYVENEIKEYELTRDDVYCSVYDGLNFNHLGQYTELFKKLKDDGCVYDAFGESLASFTEGRNNFHDTFLMRLADDVERAIKISDRVAYKQAWNSLAMELIYLAEGTDNIYHPQNKVYKENKGAAKILHEIDSAMKYAVDSVYRLEMESILAEMDEQVEA